MITGDHAVTAAAIAKQLGIEGRAITGAEFGDMSDEELLAAIDDIGVIARVTPEHKVRLVDTLKRKGHIVAMTGDGVNDAPALKKADIGIAMGITGTEVSKEAAAMILTDDNFATIVKAVELGRGLYDNLTKYIRFQMGGAGGADHHVPRRQHLQRRRRCPVPAAANPLAQLHDPGLSGDRPRLRQAERRAEGTSSSRSHAGTSAARSSAWTSSMTAGS
jgi:soluble P-type ATPase